MSVVNSMRGVPGAPPPPSSSSSSSRRVGDFTDPKEFDAPVWHKYDPDLDDIVGNVVVDPPTSSVNGHVDSATNFDEKIEHEAQEEIKVGQGTATADKDGWKEKVDSIRGGTSRTEREVNMPLVTTRDANL